MTIFAEWHHSQLAAVAVIQGAKNPQRELPFVQNRFEAAMIEKRQRARTSTWDTLEFAVPEITAKATYYKKDALPRISSLGQ